ncbi:MAG: hypothetical protein V5783_10935 [Pontiella sp.]
MKFNSLILLATASFILTGCGDKEAQSAKKEVDPTFLFWCFRKEIVSTDYHVPKMKTPEIASYLQNHIKAIPGYVDSSFNLSTQTITIEYESSSVRKMNFEEGIALAGFATNHRPANPMAKIPEGVK